jgi:hypothetical protein
MHRKHYLVVRYQPRRYEMAKPGAATAAAAAAMAVTI